MSTISILVVDNEQELRELVALHLEQAGIRVFMADSGHEAMLMLDSRSYDLIVLDIMMDEMDGFEVLRRMRALQLLTPVLLLSARHEDESKVRGFGLGADDYVTKPFSAAELVARVQAHIRRARGPYAEAIRMHVHVEPFMLDVESQTLYKSGRPIALSGTEAKLLYEMMRRPNQAIAKMELFEKTWEHPYYDDNSLNVYINYLRKKIEEDPRNPQYIHTVWGLGYKFTGE